MIDVPILHIYSSIDNHDMAAVVGNMKGLTALRDTLNEVLETDEHSDSQVVYPSDGEGYQVRVIKLEDELYKGDWEKLDAPYIEWGNTPWTQLYNWIKNKGLGM